MNLSEIFPQNKFTVGDSINFTVTLSQYPASSYVLTYVFRMDAKSVIKIIASSDSDNFGHIVNITKTQSATFYPGTYSVQAYITNISTTEKQTLGSYTWEFSPDLFTYQDDPRSAYQIALDNINELLAGKASNDVKNYTIGTRSIGKMSVSELLKLRAFYKKQVRAEQGLGEGKVIYYSFGNGAL